MRRIHSCGGPGEVHISLPNSPYDLGKQPHHLTHILRKAAEAGTEGLLTRTHLRQTRTHHVTDACNTRLVNMYAIRCIHDVTTLHAYMLACAHAHLQATGR